MTELSPIEALELITRHSESPSFIILDVRTPEEYAECHIKGAKLEPSGPDFASALSKYDKDVTFLVYCHSGSRSAGAARQMENQGFGKVFSLAGGIAAWQKTGMPVVS